MQNGFNGKKYRHTHYFTIQFHHFANASSFNLLIQIIYQIHKMVIDFSTLPSIIQQSGLYTVEYEVFNERGEDTHRVIFLFKIFGDANIF